MNNAELLAALNNEIAQRERDSIIWANSQYKEAELKRLLAIAVRDLRILGYDMTSRDARDMIRAIS